MSEEKYEKFKKYEREFVLQAYADKEKTLELYMTHYGFLYNYAKAYYGSNQNLEDFLQLGYFALEKAISSYVNTKEIKGNFLTFYKVWLNHYFFRFNCVMQQPFRIPTGEFTRVTEDISLLDSLDKNTLLQESEPIDSFVLDEELHNLLCQEMSKELDQKNYYILYEVYFNERSMASVGREVGMSRDAVRKRVLRSLKKLKENKNLQLLAYDYLGVGSR